MPHRMANWAILLWTAFMALGVVAALRGIGGDCVGMSGSDFEACQADAWARGGVGLMLLVFLWFVVVVPLAIWWFASRPRPSADPTSARS